MKAKSKKNGHVASYAEEETLIKLIIGITAAGSADCEDKRSKTSMAESQEKFPPQSDKINPHEMLLIKY